MREPSECCGCICQTCKDGHGTGPKKHSDECATRAWGAFEMELQLACPECGTICDPGDRCEVCGKVVR